MKKGFTLIELLAVIVILAIIAVIAVPIVINIIDESKENATLRSAEMYLDAVELSISDRVMHHGAIADGSYEIMSDGDICLGVYNTEGETKTCEEKPIDQNNDKILKVEVKGEKPTSGFIVIENGEIVDKLSSEETKKTQLVISDKTIVKNSNGKLEASKVSTKKVIYRWSKETVSKGADLSTFKHVEDQDDLDKDYYLKHVIENNIVTESYACTILNIDDKDQEICLRGGKDEDGNAYYEENKSVLKVLENELECTFIASRRYICENSDITMVANPSGYVYIYKKADNISSEVLETGESLCYHY